MRNSIAIVILLILISQPCIAQIFGNRVTCGKVESDAIVEASGIVASRKNPGVLWVHNDSGDESRLFAMDTKGRHLGIYRIAGVRNADWEDIAVSQDAADGRHYIQIAEIGDNSAVREHKYIFRIPEPVVNTRGPAVDTLLFVRDALKFQYSDGNRDAETLLTDPVSSNIYVVSKRESRVRVYEAGYPQNYTKPVPEKADTLRYKLTLGFHKIVGGDISADGSGILLKTYDDIYYWQRTKNQSVVQALQGRPVKVPYVPEPQGEAITWAFDSSGYYTLSEEKRGIPAILYFYPVIR